MVEITESVSRLEFQVDQLVGNLSSIREEFVLSNTSNLILIIISLIFASIAIIAIVLSIMYTRRQLHESEREMSLRVRPWIGAKLGLYFDEHVHNRLVFNYTNYGGLPAFSLTERGGSSRQQLTREQVRSLQTQITSRSTMFPNQDAEYSVTIQENLLNNLSRDSPLYVGIFIEYVYGNNRHGEYGLIAWYPDPRNRFMVIDEWSDFE